jgi:dolichyl-phosphate-mannose-protein mannosyltransferase
MAPRGARSHLGERPPSRSGKSPSRSPAPMNRRKAGTGKPADYTSVGVKDHDIFLLPGSDFQILSFLTIIATLVRLFRIYQPSSVVFDEVQ